LVVIAPCALKCNPFREKSFLSHFWA
jgi:hypothetical protein